MKITKILLLLAACWLLSAMPALAMEFTVNDRPFFSAANNGDGGSGDAAYVVPAPPADPSFTDLWNASGGEEEMVGRTVQRWRAQGR